MRELDSIAIVGPGRLGTALAGALGTAGYAVAGPFGRGEAPSGTPEAVLLCVPDSEIAAAAALIAPGPLVGHCSGAYGLDVLAGHEAFGLHPLMTVPNPQPPSEKGLAPFEAAAPFRSAGCAIAGSTPRALAAAGELARALGMRAVEVADEDRAAYHAAASLAANFLVTIEDAAERLAATAGVDRQTLAPLVLAAAANWAQRGTGALTGPIARGDEETVARQRAAVEERLPELLPLWDALVDLTREITC